MTQDKAKQLCAICGKNEAITRDHIPPKGIFPSPLPQDLITVPACKGCNGGDSSLDEKFKVYLSLHVGIKEPATEKLFHNHTIPTLEHNKKLRRHLADNIEDVIIKTPSGIIAGRAKAIKWDSEVHDRIIERTVRGLYYHHFGVILGDKAVVDVQWLEVDSPQVVKFTNYLSKNTIGEGHVAYYYVGEPEVAPCRSAWIFQFYGRHWAGGVTRPVDNKDLEFKASFLKRIRI